MELIILGSQRSVRQSSAYNESSVPHSNNTSSEGYLPTPDVVKKLEDLFVEKPPVIPQNPLFEEASNEVNFMPYCC